MDHYKLVIQMGKGNLTPKVMAVVPVLEVVLGGSATMVESKIE